MGTNGIRNMSIKLIIFDFDGTLGDTRRNIVTTMGQRNQRGIQRGRSRLYHR